MGADTKIEWAHHTFNPWIGCTRLSPACDHCYAADWAERFNQAHLWQGERRRTTAENWRKPLVWDGQAALAGERHRVFCASLADVFDNQVEPAWRADLFELIERTPNLDWMLLTKRPQNAEAMIRAAIGVEPDYVGWPWRHAWLGTTIEDRKRLINLTHLRGVPAAVRFLSIEPLLEDLGELDLAGIHLVIVGGESGPNARPMNPEWVRSILRQCLAQGVAFFFEQWGEWVSVSEVEGEGEHYSFPDGRTVRRVGKVKAGRTLDGRLWNEMPRAA
jgi:protein gp37